MICAHPSTTCEQSLLSGHCDYFLTFIHHAGIVINMNHRQLFLYAINIFDQCYNFLFDRDINYSSYQNYIIPKDSWLFIIDTSALRNRPKYTGRTDHTCRSVTLTFTQDWIKNIIFHFHIHLKKTTKQRLSFCITALLSRTVCIYYLARLLFVFFFFNLLSHHEMHYSPN